MEPDRVERARTILIECVPKLHYAASLVEPHDAELGAALRSLADELSEFAEDLRTPPRRPHRLWPRLRLHR